MTDAPGFPISPALRRQLSDEARALLRQALAPSSPVVLRRDLEPELAAIESFYPEAKATIHAADRLSIVVGVGDGNDSDVCITFQFPKEYPDVLPYVTLRSETVDRAALEQAQTAINEGCAEWQGISVGVPVIDMVLGSLEVWVVLWNCSQMRLGFNANASGLRAIRQRH